VAKQRDGWLSRETSRHFSKIFKRRHRKRSGQHTLARQKNIKNTNKFCPGSYICYTQGFNKPLNCVRAHPPAGLPQGEEQAGKEVPAWVSQNLSGSAGIPRNLELSISNTSLISRSLPERCSPFLSGST